MPSPRTLRHACALVIALGVSPASHALTPLDDADLAASQAAGLDAASLQALSLGSALPALAAPATEDSGHTLALAEAGLQQQGTQRHQQTAWLAAQLAGGSAALGASLLMLPALPLMLPVIGLPLLGLPMLPPPRKS